MERTNLFEPLKTRLSKPPAGIFHDQQICRAPNQRVHRRERGVRTSQESHVGREAISFLIFFAVVLAISFCAMLSNGGGRAGEDARSGLSRLPGGLSRPQSSTLLHER